MQLVSPRSRWLPLRDGHAVPLKGLQPDDLKAAAKAIRQGPGEKIGHTTILNAVVKALGFEAGFPGYLREGAPRVERFLHEHGLREPRELFGSEFKTHTLSREALSGRLFHSGRPMPRRVWLGSDGFDWDPIVPAAQSYLPDRDQWWKISFLPMEKALDLAKQDVSLVPMVLARGFGECDSGANLLGDVLLDPRDGSGAVIQTYWQNDIPTEKRERSTRNAHKMVALFRTWIEQSPLGWVDVLPVTEKLVILRGRDGGWDFVFANLRDSPPSARPFADMLVADDVPVGLYQTEVVAEREYARLGAWRELESHLAEEFFYASGGKVADYPGLDEVLWRYLRATGALPSLPPSTASTCPAGWTPVVMGGKKLFVSPLVTIAEFESFLAASGYRERRRVEASLEDANGQDPKHLPVTVTWFDALAYAAWVEATRKLPVRLLRVDEYMAVHPGALPPRYRRRVEEGCVDFTWSDGRPLTHWKVGDDYGRLKLKARFKEQLLWRQGQGGLPFLCSDSFGEWLLEHAGNGAAAINTHDLEAIIERQASPKRHYFLADDWGAYQACKIGFRLCVDAG